jgi:hypothetical protein
VHPTFNSVCIKFHPRYNTHHTVNVLHLLSASSPKSQFKKQLDINELSLYVAVVTEIRYECAPSHAAVALLPVMPLGKAKHPGSSTLVP